MMTAEFDRLYAAALCDAILETIGRNAAISGGDGPPLFQAYETIDALVTVLSTVLVQLPAMDEPEERCKVVNLVTRRIEDLTADMLKSPLMTRNQHQL